MFILFVAPVIDSSATCPFEPAAPSCTIPTVLPPPPEILTKLSAPIAEVDVFVILTVLLSELTLTVDTPVPSTV